MYKLRDYQQKASDAAVSFFNNRAKKTNVIMVLPTGSGKSLIIADIAARLDGHTLVFQPSKEILEQMHIKENDNLNVTVHDGKMVLEKAEKPKYLSFRERVEAFYGKPFEQVCLEREQLGEKVEEIDTGAPVGDEYW